MNNFIFYLLLALLIYYLFFNNNIENMDNNNNNNNDLLKHFIDISDNDYISRKNYPPNHIILRCKYNDNNICNKLKISDKFYNAKILNVHDDYYPLITDIGIKKGDEIIVKPYDFEINHK
jgi:hypothetical protein